MTPDPDNWDSPPTWTDLLRPFLVMALAVFVFAAALGTVAAIVWNGGAP